jgi:hypothetical protein
VGFDERFAYGRVDVGAAMRFVEAGKVPPTVLFRGPTWWQLLDPAAQASLPIVADTGSRTATHEVVVEAARGIEPDDAAFTPLLEVDGLTGTADARDLGDLQVADLAALFGPGFDFTSPPSDVNEYAVTLRARVTDSAGGVGEDRRVVWLHTDPALLDGFPQFMDRGGESSPRLADLDGDAQLEIVLTDSGGRTRVLGRDGRDVPFWNGGQGVLAPVLAEAAPHASAPAYRAGVPLPRGVSLTPAVADLDGDGALEVVVTNSGGSITVYDRFGAVRSRMGIDRSIARPELLTGDYHLKRGFFGAASVGDVSAQSPGLEVVAGGLDGHVYAWSGGGQLLPGFPTSLNSADTGEERRGAELITIPTLAQLDADPQVEIVIAGSEVVDSTGGTSPPESPPTSRRRTARCCAASSTAPESWVRRTSVTRSTATARPCRAGRWSWTRWCPTSCRSSARPTSSPRSTSTATAGTRWCCRAPRARSRRATPTARCARRRSRWSAPPATRTSPTAARC